MSEDTSQYDIMAEFSGLMASVYPNPPFLAKGMEDTTLVLTATSMVDEFLKVVLIAGFNKDAVSKRRITEVFTGYGPLASFSSKISVAGLLGLTTQNVQHDLTVLRKIRNDFAHSREPLHLNSFASCLSLRMTSKINVDDPIDHRKKFKHSCMSAIGNLSSAITLRIAQARFVSKNADAVIAEHRAMISELGDL